MGETVQAPIDIARAREVLPGRVFSHDDVSKLLGLTKVNPPDRVIGYDERHLGVDLPVVLTPFGWSPEELIVKLRVRTDEGTNYVMRQSRDAYYVPSTAGMRLHVVPHLGLTLEELERCARSAGLFINVSSFASHVLSLAVQVASRMDYPVGRRHLYFSQRRLAVSVSVEGEISVALDDFYDNLPKAVTLVTRL